MKKLFLCSNFKSVENLLKEFINENLIGKKVTFIPTASIHEEVDFYVAEGRESLEKLGMIVEILEISSSSQLEIINKLESNEIIYISGGNTFFLLQELKRTGADKVIEKQIKLGKVFIGESAGSMILSPNIKYVEKMDDSAVASDLESYDSLNIIDFYPVPHYTEFPFKESVEEIILEYERRLPLILINNSQVILVNGDNIKICGK
ncbi:MAG: Type 1 glutamine amidotransferase-like domain-containing protein [Fusobacteriaceae bacterium]